MHCQQGGYHKDEQLEMICLNNDCITSGEVLGCVVCFEEKHKGHKVIGLNKLLNLIKKQQSLISVYVVSHISKQSPSKNLDQTIVQLNSIQGRLNQIINKQRELIEAKLKIEQMIPSFELLSQIQDVNLLNILIQRVLIQIEYNPRSQSLLIRNNTLKTQDEDTSLLQKLLSINDLIENSDTDKKGMSSRASSIYKPNKNKSINEGYRTMRSFDRSPLSPQPFEDKLSVTQSLSNPYYRPKSIDRPLIGQPSPPPPMKEMPFHFHSEYHGIGFQITGKVGKQILNTVGCLALIGPSIYGNGIIRDSKIKLLIRSCQNQNLRYPMAVGVCDQKSAKRKGFQQDVEGAYLNSNGYIRSGTLNKSKVRYYSGSTLEVAFKPFQSEMVIKLDNNQEVSVKVTLKSDSLLYFFIRMGDLYDCIEIL